MAAQPAQHAALGVAHARHGTRHGCAVRLDGDALARLLDHAGFIHTFCSPHTATPIHPEAIP